ncbi:uncharacterized protein LOC115034445 [Acyrthosiphon pisum]|uniref:Uncharacterized protein n=1 Tax=Acyrthosiphon pisum TaxID=7029 RepID=A0A8R2JVW0_ACYPI|nr:uncharacterized protein LOC115034445 [Acyrthosiphon pisum]
MDQVQIVIQLIIGCTLVMSQLRFSDNQLPPKSGIYYENIGPIKIVTNTWDLVFFLDTSGYNEQWDIIEDHMHKLQSMCTELDGPTFVTPVGCQPLLNHVLLINKKLLKRKQLLLDSVELRFRRGIIQYTRLKQIQNFQFYFSNQMPIGSFGCFLAGKGHTSQSLHQ